MSCISICLYALELFHLSVEVHTPMISSVYVHMVHLYIYLHPSQPRYMYSSAPKMNTTHKTPASMALPFHLAVFSFFGTLLMRAPIGRRSSRRAASSRPRRRPCRARTPSSTPRRSPRIRSRRPGRTRRETWTSRRRLGTGAATWTSGTWGPCPKSRCMWRTWKEVKVSGVW